MYLAYLQYSCLFFYILQSFHSKILLTLKFMWLFESMLKGVTRRWHLMYSGPNTVEMILNCFWLKHKGGHLWVQFYEIREHLLRHMNNYQPGYFSYYQTLKYDSWSTQWFNSACDIWNLPLLFFFFLKEKTSKQTNLGQNMKFIWTVIFFVFWKSMFIPPLRGHIFTGQGQIMFLMGSVQQVWQSLLLFSHRVHWKVTLNKKDHRKPTSSGTFY